MYLSILRINFINFLKLRFVIFTFYKIEGLSQKFLLNIQENGLIPTYLKNGKMTRVIFRKLIKFILKIDKYIKTY